MVTTRPADVVLVQLDASPPTAPGTRLLRASKVARDKLEPGEEDLPPELVPGGGEDEDDGAGDVSEDVSNTPAEEVDEAS